MDCFAALAMAILLGTLIHGGRGKHTKGARRRASASSAPFTTAKGNGRRRARSVFYFRALFAATPRLAFAGLASGWAEPFKPD